jgi:hypothetical protein
VHTNQLDPIPHPRPNIPACLTPEALPQASGTAELVAMRQCPKFDSCNVPICPLDPNWQLRDMTQSDGTCTWLREVVKAGPQAQGVPDIIRDRVASALPALVYAHGLAPLRSALKKAAKTGSKRSPCALLRLRPAGHTAQTLEA